MKVKGATGIVWALVAILVATPASATVFINEILINPAGTIDESYEYIELMGTPGKRLDGYAIAIVNGALEKYYPLGSIPPVPAVAPEIDEFFSLDGLALGDNGLLVLAISNFFNYPTVVPGTTFRGNWITVWNGGQGEAPGQLQNDGSNTILLIRRRPGRTQANPLLLPIWVKDGRPDNELVTPSVDPQTGSAVDQYGDGDFDEGQSNGTGGSTFDLRGSSTPFSTTDDLEVVDEVSYEHERGWEYDLDARDVDIDSSESGFPERRVHALDDCQGFNPNALTRVDYRTKGEGWEPADGAIGEMANGNNWQDTATEQWIRGETTLMPQQDDTILFFYSNAANANADAIQPFMTNVPLWLDDGVAPDYNFAQPRTYNLTPGRINPFAIPFIPGDADRDGDADQDDINKIAAVFGDNDWLFSNSFSDAPESNDGDPGMQTRPWDVDATGSNGVEPSDLQWTLNFFGNTNGRVVGRFYDSTTPTAQGVALNNAASVSCNVTMSVTPETAGEASTCLGESVVLAVYAQVAAGANMTAGQQNGVMQFVHDLQFQGIGPARVTSIEPAAPFAFTRPTLMSLSAGGLGGAIRINGYTTSFTVGLTAPAPLYHVTIEGESMGAVNILLNPINHPNLSATTPFGLKVGHTNNNGNPANVNYPAPLQLMVTDALIAPNNCDCDLTVTADDHACFADCLYGPTESFPTGCMNFDTDEDGDVDFADWTSLQNTFDE